MDQYPEVWAVDFEFSAQPGENPIPICMVAIEYRTGRAVRTWADELAMMPNAPFPADSLIVAYYASAEVGCYLSLGWDPPRFLLDLYVEFRNATNGLATNGSGLLAAMAWYGIPTISSGHKQDMRQMAIDHGHGAHTWAESDRLAMLDYCESDVIGTNRLLRAMVPGIDWPRAVNRGRYMTAVARMERAGIPIDGRALATLRANWTAIKTAMIDRVDRHYGVYDGGSFKASRFAEYLGRNRIPWPLLPSGSLDLSDGTFREMSRSHPAIRDLHELRATLSKLKLERIAVGSDSRNRCLLSPFRSKTGRNQPSNASFIFGPATWIRGLIKPAPGRAIAYIDWSQQEFAIAAVLSGDAAMLAAYESGDPYLAFAIDAGLAPAGATKATHGTIRDACKAVILGTQYGMGADSLAGRIGTIPVHARQLLDAHRRTYRVYWDWVDRVQVFASLKGAIWTALGWRLLVTPDTKSRALANFPMQANGAEMMRQAVIRTQAQGVTVCAPVHDALLIEAPMDGIGDAVRITQGAMAQASIDILGYAIRSDAKVVPSGARYMDERGAGTWAAIWAGLGIDPDGKAGG